MKVKLKLGYLPFYPILCFFTGWEILSGRIENRTEKKDRQNKTKPKQNHNKHDLILICAGLLLWSCKVIYMQINGKQFNSECDIFCDIWGIKMSDIPDEDGSVRTPVSFDHQFREGDGDDLHNKLQNYQEVRNRCS